MKKVLIVSPHFPPVNSPDCQRVRISLPYYREFGWEPTVLAVDPRHRSDWKDESLLESIPRDVAIHRCSAFDVRFTRLIGVSNLGLRCVAQLNRLGAELLAQGRFDAVFFSTTQYLTAPLGRVWRRDFGVPYVLDLQDPWRSDYYERPGAPKPPGGWKYLFARLTARLLEEGTVKSASALMSVSPRYLLALQRRYRWAEIPPHAVIPLGAPEADFDYLSRQPNTAPPQCGFSPGCFHWVATGALNPSFSHALRVLFAGLRRLRLDAPHLAGRLRFTFIGTSYADPRRRAPAALDIARDYGVADLVKECPARVGYLDSLRLMRAANGLVLLGSDDLAYVPSKLFPYLLAERPILSLAHDRSALAQQLGDLPITNAVTLLRPGEEMLAAPEVAQVLRHAAEGDTSAWGAPPVAVAAFRKTYSAAALTQQQCELFDAAVAHHRGSRPRTSR